MDYKNNKKQEYIQPHCIEIFLELNDFHNNKGF